MELNPNPGEKLLFFSDLTFDWAEDATEQQLLIKWKLFVNNFDGNLLIILWSKNTKHFLVLASVMWGFAAFSCYMSLKTEYCLVLDNWLDNISNKKGQV